jgi:hypothetical protein
MAEVAKADGIEPTMGQSPFAIARGLGFERTLFRDDAARLRTALSRVGLLPDPNVPFLDLRLRQAGGTTANLDEALDKTTKTLAQAAQLARGGSGTVPGIITGATLSIPGGAMLPEAILVLDVLLLHREGERIDLIAGEIKTYPDRAGYTDAAELATARAQLGTYVHGLELVVGQIVRNGELRPQLHGFLVLSRPGFNLPSIRPREDLRYQVERARRGLVRLREAAESNRVPTGANPLDVVRVAPCAYSTACVSFCDRAELCYERARSDGRAVILGEDVERFLGGVSLSRMKELLEGDAPQGDGEADLVHRLDELRRSLRRA